jgi:hypothetical protein
MYYLYLLILINILFGVFCTGSTSTYSYTKSNKNTNTYPITKYSLIKYDQEIKKLELDLEYAKVLNQNINYIDNFWNGKFKSLNYAIKNNNYNKANVVNQALNLDGVIIKYPNNYTQFINKYHDIIIDIVNSNENFTNNIITNIPTDIDTENVKNGLIQKIFLSDVKFFTYLQLSLDKISQIESNFIKKKKNYDYDFFGGKYMLYSDSYQIILDKIYLFKLQNQIELNKIIKSYKQSDYDSLQNHIFISIEKLLNQIIKFLENN